MCRAKWRARLFCCTSTSWIPRRVGNDTGTCQWSEWNRGQQLNIKQFELMKLMNQLPSFKIPSSFVVIMILGACPCTFTITPTPSPTGRMWCHYACGTQWEVERDYWTKVADFHGMQWESQYRWLDVTCFPPKIGAGCQIYSMCGLISCSLRTT